MKLSKQSQLDFAQQLLTLFNAGLALLSAIELIQLSAPKNWQPWLRNIQTLLQKGNSLSQCLINQKGLFSMEFINLIRVSERTGDIALALKTICTQLEAQIELTRKVKQSLSYPMITLSSSFLLVIVMMIWVVPVFKDVFGHFQAELPLPTKILIETSTLINQIFIELCGCLVFGSLVFLFIWIKSIRLQKTCDRWSFSIPIFGNLLRLAALTYWCRTLGHLLESGLPLPDALRITAQSSNHWLSHDLSAEIFKQLTLGWPLGDALRKSDPRNRFFDKETLQLLYIASESGFLAQMLSKRANSLSSQLSNRLNNLSQTLEPLLIMIVGTIIGALVIILYLPIFHLGQII